MSEEGLSDSRGDSRSPLRLLDRQQQQELELESRGRHREALPSTQNTAPCTPVRATTAGTGTGTEAGQSSGSAAANNKRLVQSIEKRFNRVLHFLTPSSSRQMPPGSVLVARDRDEEPPRIGSFSNLNRFKVSCSGL